MSTLPINNRSDDRKHAGLFPSLFGQHFDDFFDHFSTRFPFVKTESQMAENKMGFVTPKVDVTENKKAYNLTAELPGLDSNDIKLDLSDGILSISGEKKFEKEEDTEDNVHIMERSYGSFQRSFSLPQSVEMDSINAEFKKGVLKVTLPKTVKAQENQRKIEINS